MAKAHKFTQPKTHTIVQRKRRYYVSVEYFCTTCGRVIDGRDVNKRCKSGRVGAP